MRTLATLAVIAAFQPLVAQSPSPAGQGFTELSIHSAKLGETRSVYVVPPFGYATGRDRYAVLIILDANDAPQFRAAVANTEFLTSRGVAPPLIIVGVPNGKDRTHDLTPAATGDDHRQFPTAGGAGPFVDFLVDELLPAVRAKYRTLPTTVLAGHSFGGLLVLHAASARPEAFAGIVAMSPSLWWNDTTAATGYADSVAHAPHEPRLFASSGEFEPAIDGPAHRFAARLDSIKPASLAFAYTHYDGDTHGLTPQPSLIDGLRFVFQPVSLVYRGSLATTGLQPGADSADMMNAYVAMRDRYAAGARSLGLPEALPEQVTNAAGQAALGQLKQPRLAVWLFRQTLAAYPESLGGLEGLGDALLASGDVPGARAQLEKALAVAQRSGQGDAASLRKKISGVSQAGSSRKP